MNDFIELWQYLVKIGLSPSQKNCIIGLIESPLKMMRNAFYFILKALFVFVTTFWSYRKNDLIRKMRLTSKIYDVTDWFTNNCNTHIAQYLTTLRQPDSLVN